MRLQSIFGRITALLDINRFGRKAAIPKWAPNSLSLKKLWSTWTHETLLFPLLGCPQPTPAFVFGPVGMVTAIWSISLSLSFRLCPDLMSTESKSLDSGQLHSRQHSHIEHHESYCFWVSIFPPSLSGCRSNQKKNKEEERRQREKARRSRVAKKALDEGKLVE